MWRQREICPLIAANHSALPEFLRFLRNILPFRWQNFAKIKKFRNANTTNKESYSGARRCIMPNISTFKHTASCNGACNWLAGGLLANEQARDKSAVVFIVISARNECLT